MIKFRIVPFKITNELIETMAAKRRPSKDNENESMSNSSDEESVTSKPSEHRIVVVAGTTMVYWPVGNWTWPVVTKLRDD